MTQIESPFQLRGLSSRDRDPEYELEDGWRIAGDGTAAVGKEGGLGECESQGVLLFVK